MTDWVLLASHNKLPTAFVLEIDYKSIRFSSVVVERRLMVSIELGCIFVSFVLASHNSRLLSITSL